MTEDRLTEPLIVYEPPCEHSAGHGTFRIVEWYDPWDW